MTKIEKEVERMYKHLRPVKLNERRIIKNYYAVGQERNGHIYCTYCGGDCGKVDKLYNQKQEKYSWYPTLTPKNDKPVICPHCHKELCHVDFHEYRHYIGYYATFQKHQNWQVIRMHFVALHTNHNKPGTFTIYPDNYQVWYNEKGDRVTIGHRTSMFPRKTINPLSQWSPMAIRRNGGEYITNDYQSMEITSLTPWFKEAVHLDPSINMAQIDDIMLHRNKLNFDPYFETLEKMGLHELVNKISKGDMKKYRKQIRISVFRRNYHIEDWTMYKDMIDTLRKLKMDVLSPKYICPENLWMAHQKWLGKFELQKDAISIQEKMKRAMAENSKYINLCKKFLKIVIQNEHMVIRPLQSVPEFLEEGTYMHHCVYTNKYYEHKDTLILSAKTHDGTRLATIEYNTARNEIIQVKAAYNITSPYDQEIRQLIINNKKVFRKAMAA